MLFWDYYSVVQFWKSVDGPCYSIPRGTVIGVQIWNPARNLGHLSGDQLIYDLLPCFIEPDTMLQLQSTDKTDSTFALSVAIRRPQDSGADPGFPVGGGADPLGGAPTYDFVKFSQKLHEIKKILGRRSARAGGAPLLGSATEINCVHYKNSIIQTIHSNFCLNYVVFFSRNFHLIKWIRRISKYHACMN